MNPVEMDRDKFCIFKLFLKDLLGACFWVKDAPKDSHGTHVATKQDFLPVVLLSFFAQVEQERERASSNL